MIGAMIYTKQRAYFEILLLSPLGNRTYFTGFRSIVYENLTKA